MMEGLLDFGIAGLKKGLRFTGLSDDTQVGFNHRLSINRPTKRGKEKSRSDGHCQREKEMGDHLLPCQKNRAT
jgi:hypothetical protein